MKYILWYLVTINVITFLVFAVDKKKAEKGKWRTKERTLFILAAMGGSIGAILGMAGMRHKTRKLKFVFGIPALLLCQAAACWWIIGGR